VRIVYIAGAYSGPTLSEVVRHVDEARKAALMLAERRIPFLCTILQTAHFELLLGRLDPGYDYWIDVSLEVLKRCGCSLPGAELTGIERGAKRSRVRTRAWDTGVQRPSGAGRVDQSNVTTTLTRLTL